MDFKFILCPFNQGYGIASYTTHFTCYNVIHDQYFSKMLKLRHDPLSGIRKPYFITTSVNIHY